MTNRSRSGRLALLLLLTWLIGALPSTWAGSKVYVGKQCRAANRPSIADVSHDGFDALLRKYVNDQSRVAYGKWKASAGDVAALDRYLVRLSCVDLSKRASKAAKLAFWINAYNAVTLKGILREYPTTSIKNHASRTFGYNVWKDLMLWVDKDQYSLDDIEHKILRRMGEPRIHFAINCASKGCPPLANQAFTTTNVEKLMEHNARRFFAQPSNFSPDARSRTVYVSTLLKWYGKDFAKDPQQQMKILVRYFPSPERLGWIAKENVRVRYLKYDWGLNDQKQ